MKNKFLLIMLCLGLVAVMAGCTSAQGGETPVQIETQAVTQAVGQSVTQTPAEGEAQAVTQNEKEESADLSAGNDAPGGLELPDDVFAEADETKAHITDSAQEKGTAAEDIAVTEADHKATEPQEAELTKLVMDYNSKGEGIVLPDDVWE